MLHVTTTECAISGCFSGNATTFLMGLRSTGNRQDMAGTGVSLMGTSRPDIGSVPGALFQCWARQNKMGTSRPDVGSNVISGCWLCCVIGWSHMHCLKELLLSFESMAAHNICRLHVTGQCKYFYFCSGQMCCVRFMFFLPCCLVGTLTSRDHSAIWSSA